MEQIIILIVIGLLSTLFSKKGKDDQNQKQKTPPGQQPGSQRQQTPSSETDPFKRLKELTGDLYKEFQEEQKKQEPAPEQQKQTQPAVLGKIPVEQAKTIPARVSPDRHSSRASKARDTRPAQGRLSVHNPEISLKKQEVSSRIDITSEEDLLKGIIFSEILGPPKSKQ